MSSYLLTYLLHGAESFLRSQLVLQLVKKFPAFMEPESSLPYSQVSVTWHLKKAAKEANAENQKNSEKLLDFLN
jgi:hypothetical protein